MPSKKAAYQSTTRWPIASVSDIAWSDAPVPASRHQVASDKQASLPAAIRLGSVTPMGMAVDMVASSLLGIVDRIVYYRLEAQRIDAQTESIRMQTKVICKKIDREFELRMAALEMNRKVLLKLCQQGQFEQENIRMHLKDKQAKAESMLKAALAVGMPPEKMHQLLELYGKETEGCTVLLQMSLTNYKDRLTQLLPALSVQPAPLAIDHNP